MSIRSINPYIVDMLSKANFLYPPKKSDKNDIFKKSNDIMTNMFTSINKLQNISMAIKSGVSIDQDSRLDHHKYITSGNPVILNIARKITDYSDSNDEKIFKIEKWVQTNIEYVSDIKNYGKLERWAYPIETLKRMSGDCEDQAFLLHSLALASGVEPSRIRTYGGLVFDPTNISPGGHGWNVYKRENDNRWIAVDTTYYVVSNPIYDRIPISEDFRYIDDFWYIESSQTVATPYANKIRYAIGTLFDIQI